ncbi:TPA: sigma-54-dependent transcriptional regulator [Salmonella enterica]|nr:sigma-54-dependent transcriptional regulator [Salmonella enterica]HDY3399771.1 sigma-54-dependent transcriptional regulator [Salmonella enterica]HDY3408341.1 sigma-54-dependent transcriptional regulator [Salmonella enterica]
MNKTKDIAASPLCFVSPYPQLAKAAEALVAQLDYAVTIHQTTLNRILDELPLLESRGHQVLISRGGCAEILKKHSKLPVVEIKMSGYDILDALIPFKGQKGTVGIVGFSSVIKGCARVAEQLNINYKIFTLQGNDKETISCLKRQLVSTPLDCIVGDTVCQDYFSPLGSQFRLLDSSPASITEALEEARSLYLAFRSQLLERHHLQLILDQFDKAVITLDDTGALLHYNKYASQLFKINASGEIYDASFLKQVLHQERHTLREGKTVSAKVVDTPQGAMVVNLYPVFAARQLSRVVLTMQTVSSLQGAEHHVRRQELSRRGLSARYHFDDLLTENPEMLRRLAIIKNYAGTDATILINGESGTGKEVLAQSIHNASQRVNGPFVAINCGAMAPQILESELFGYVAGAFTGASPKGKIGLFELAHHGTIFLDEISELDKPLQTRLLRVLQERQIMRLGSDQMISVDIRVIAATNQTLTRLIADGTFREDLYYRLNVLKVTTIPLRKRPEDIKAIGLSLLTSFSQHYKRPALTLTPALWQELQRFAWPGNVRQLSNIIERLVLSIDHSPATLDEGRLLLDDLEEGSRREPTTCHDCQMLAGDYKTIRLRILRKLLEAERDNKSLVAKRLNVDRTSLTRWIRESA